MHAVLKSFATVFAYLYPPSELHVDNCNLQLTKNYIIGFTAVRRCQKKKKMDFPMFGYEIWKLIK